MILLTPQQRARLRANGDAAAIGTPGHDPAPVVKLFNPVGAATWLATELAADNATMFGLAALGFGRSEEHPVGKEVVRRVGGSCSPHSSNRHLSCIYLHPQSILSLGS